jgi:hypothetical protein
MQQAEVQEVTFSAGMGVGGSTTLTYTDLYGQSWTTRPISLGEGSHYVLDYALGSGADANNAYLVLSYGGVTGQTAANTLSLLTADKIRNTLWGLSSTGLTTTQRANLARSIRVTERPHKTSHKFSSGIEAAKKKTFDVYMTADVTTGLEENGGLKEFSAYLSTVNSDSVVTTEIDSGDAFVQVVSMSDASSEIKRALEGLPNNVIPSVSVSKVDVTTENTNDRGTYGNAFHQTYRITFSNAMNSGDQTMLSCDANPCDNDGCINRRVGVSSVYHIHADPTFADQTTAKKTAKVNFQGQGYFIMDIHRDIQNDPATNDFSAGTAYLEWNTGAGVDRAEFPIIATAETVQTSLRTITGWSGVTVSSQCAEVSPCLTLDRAHSYTVTFPSGYDDGGQTPKVGLVSGYGGTAGAQVDGGSNPAPDGKIIIYDQRFSNSLWLGDVTGYALFTCAYNDDECTGGGFAGEIGDMFDETIVQFGHMNSANGYTGAGGAAGTATDLNGQTVRSTFTNMYANSGAGQLGVPAGHYTSKNLKVYIKVNHDADFPLQTSQDTDNYFPVGSTIEVLATTWAESAPQTPITHNVNDHVNENVYRSFKVLSHVENTHGHMFAKLDSVPTTDSSEKYALKVTAHNSTVTNRKNIELNANQQEVQIIRPLDTNDLFLLGDADTFRIYINKDKANVEYTEVLTGVSTNVEIAEAINSFSALSGPVTVTITNEEIRVTFAAIDGDVPELEVVEEVDADNSVVFSVKTVSEGWSFFAGYSARLENVQPGSVINVTSQEQVSFSITSWTGTTYLVFAYDGEVGATGVLRGTIDADKVVDAVNSIKNEKGLDKFSIDSTAVTTSTSSSIVISMPEGIDASKLELLPASGTTVTKIEKTVAKNNNGRSFKVLRVENNNWDISDNLTVTGITDAKVLDYSTHNKGPFAAGDEIQFKQSTAGTNCLAMLSASATDAVMYRYLDAGAVTSSKVSYNMNTAIELQNVDEYSLGACSVKVYRTTLVVDSMPDTMSATGFGADVNLHIYGPKGSCSVSEAVKGTYESDVCSSRGNCDGASGLCACHEGYSGEACETQTVLV